MERVNEWTSELTTWIAHYMDRLLTIERVFNVFPTRSNASQILPGASVITVEFLQELRQWRSLRLPA